MQPNETLPLLSITSEDKLEISFLRSTSSFDGHSLRAHSYWGDQMPDIQQATNEERCFMVDGISFKETDTIKYNGKSYTGLEFYNLHK